GSMAFAAGALVNGGTIAAGAGTVLATEANASATLDAVTLGSDFAVASGSTLIVRNGLDLGGHKLTLRPGPGNSFVSFQGASQTLAGTGEVVFAGTGASSFLDQSLTAGETLTIGANVLVHGAAGGSSAQVRVFNGPLVNDGTFLTDVAGQT